MCSDDGAPLAGEYAVGWIKRGPSGVIGTNKKDAADTVARIVEDAEAGRLLDPAFRTWSLEQEAAAVTAPTLLVQGGDDPYGTLEQVDRIEARVRGRAERVVMEGAGHSPHLDDPEPVLRAIAAFSDRLP